MNVPILELITKFQLAFGDPDPQAKCVLCRLFPEQQADHDQLHHKLDIQDGALVELPIEPPPDKEPS